MEEYYEKLKEIEPVDKLFDYIRIIDIKDKSVFYEQRINSSLISVPPFVYKKRQELYNNCIARNKAIYQVEQEGQLLLLFAVLPVSIDKEKLVMECIANITGRITINGSLDESANALNNAYRLSVTDELTGLYNRRYINHTLPLDIADCVNQEIPLSVLFTDLDYFKEINDDYGHSAGDYFLYEFAIELRKNIRKDVDWIARYGGDEFLLCLIGVNNSKAKTIADQIRKSIEQKIFVYDGNEIKTTCSIGVYTLSQFHDLPTSDYILKEVDNHLYKAKKSGRNKVM
ncbi:diguanylate cyclase (GGDEF) domain-containing protein [Gottschalkia acidurici 9a]|uniref:Diguanylate cyclase (GGDEF) domain-containing protein n=1 Tax=Gottschalkia acidurici (strain ATCC 7906 / DSM 604 / BCRC 14475 / CIP 104303 / KCTC 5404 / NCIMB 10678 / 9a) TaxID=1128398 RepID=K0AYU2_GOTA9|nr:GGDEF domain-containing protein [Gottschalkia acidurici]AFS77591.1 diguanylate cyclase (GGDEF) domain-containing protein [Gottschalkia acidurici 9a]